MCTGALYKSTLGILLHDMNHFIVRCYRGFWLFSLRGSLNGKEAGHDTVFK